MKKVLSRPSTFTLLIYLHLAVLLLAAVVLVRQKGRPHVHSRDKEAILVIPIEGIISGERGALGRGSSVESIVETLSNVREQENVKAVVLRINSPGGTVPLARSSFAALISFRREAMIIMSVVPRWPIANEYPLK